MVRYLTGFQPTGALHIGNYFGSVAPGFFRKGRGVLFHCRFPRTYHDSDQRF